MKLKIIFLTLIILNSASGFIASGKATLSSKNGLNKIGFNLLNGTITGNNGDFYYFEGRLWTNGPYGIKIMNNNPSSCDLTGYMKSIPIYNNTYYCIKANDGSFGKIYVINALRDTIKIIWYHQRDGTNLFKENEKKEIKPNFDWLYISIIILLLIIIIVLWRLR